MNVNDGVGTLRGIGEKRAELFARLGVRTVGDLLRFYPRDYLDFTPVPIASAPPGELCCIRARVVRANVSRVRRGMTLYRFRAADDSAVCDITFFNNRYVQSLLREGDAYLFYGRMAGSLFRREMASPEFEAEDAAPGLRPVYPLTAGLSSRNVAAAVRQALETCPPDAEDPLPAPLRERHGLCSLREALHGIHFPAGKEELSAARRRLVFEEFLALSLGLFLLRGERGQGSAPVCADTDFAPFFAKLPFSPTGAQRRAIAEGAADMRGNAPMNRLVEGDVGSGKTAVAAALCWFAAQNGLQAALMAPTEILAGQHFQTLTALLAPLGLNVGLLTGGMPVSERRRVLRMLAAGQLDVAVGTHALLSEGVEFHALGLVVTDEQHRFGVGQRAALAAKGRDPHVLVMSATPIPRTLALLLYGDLELSVLDEMPRGRLTVRTYAVGASYRPRVYAFLKKELRAGHRAFIVCPLVEDSGEGETGLMPATEYAEQLARNEFREFRVGLLHGRLAAAQKEAVMRDFAQGRLQLLVSTTVIEVGVDVPEATVMVVENAERFGLSQLHQLRGRVGRGRAQSTCILISDARGADASARLRTLCETNDGFRIAEKDLELRGPGDFFGRRQHGLPELRIADFASDMGVLCSARDEARALLAADPHLAAPGHAKLKAHTNSMFAQQDVVFN